MTTAANAFGWPLGCQARPWLQQMGQERFSHELPRVMRQIASIGFTGFETALACLPLDVPERFIEASAAADGLVLSGAHAGGKWWDAQAAETIPTLVAKAARLPALGCTRLVVSTSGLAERLTDAQVAQLTEALGDLGRRCRAEANVSVVYHNHAGELADDARVIAAIVEQCAPEDVALGTDLGWVVHAGTDVRAFLQRFGSRIAYLHVRDVTDDGTQGGFIEVGRGVLDHQAIFAELHSLGYTGWLVAESEFNPYWRGLTEPVGTATAQFDGLRSALGRA